MQSRSRSFSRATPGVSWRLPQMDCPHVTHAAIFPTGLPKVPETLGTR